MSRSRAMKRQFPNRECLGPSRRLRFEHLESRLMLTLAEFHINLYEDAGGTLGEPIEDGTVPLGDTFYLEVVVEDVQSDPLGLHGISLDINWDPNAFVVVDPFDASALVTDSFPLFPFGTLEPNVGRINDLSGSAGVGLGIGELVGRHGPEQFALIRLQAAQVTDNARFSMRGGKYEIAFFPPIWYEPGDITFETQAITVVDPASLNATEPSGARDDDNLSFVFSTSSSPNVHEATEAETGSVATSEPSTESNREEEKIALDVSSHDPDAFGNVTAPPSDSDGEMSFVDRTMTDEMPLDADAIHGDTTEAGTTEMTTSNHDDTSGPQGGETATQAQETPLAEDPQEDPAEQNVAASHTAENSTGILERSSLYGPVQEPIRYLVVDLFEGLIRPVRSSPEPVIDAVFADVERGMQIPIDDGAGANGTAIQDTSNPGMTALFADRGQIEEKDQDESSGVGSRLEELEELVGLLAEEVNRIGQACRIGE